MFYHDLSPLSTDEGVCVGGRKVLEEEDEGKRKTSMWCLFFVYDRDLINPSIHGKKYDILKSIRDRGKL